MSTNINYTAGNLALNFSNNNLDSIYYCGNKVAERENWQINPIQTMHAWAGFAEPAPPIPTMSQMKITDTCIESIAHGDDVDIHIKYYNNEPNQLRIRISINNKNNTNAILAWCYIMPSFCFTNQPYGYFSETPINQLNNFTAHYYPGQFRRCGAAYLASNEFAIAAYRLGTPTHRYLFWLRSDYGTNPQRPLWYTDLEPIKPNTELVRELAIEFADNQHQRTIYEMLEEYKNNLPLAAYTSTENQSGGIMIQGIRANISACNNNNPYGYTNLNWRFDTQQGAEAYRDYIISQCSRLNIIGLIHWTLGITDGEKVFGMYALNPTRIGIDVRNHFDILFGQLGCQAGHLLRLDYLQAQNETDPGILPMLDDTAMSLFAQQMQRSPLYLDSTGFEANPRETRLIHNCLLGEIRGMNHTGRWFVEHANDLTLGLAGGFGMIMKNPYQVYGFSMREWELLRWLRPGAEWILGICEGHGVEPSRRTTEPGEVIDGAAALGGIPLIQDWRLGEL